MPTKKGLMIGNSHAAMIVKAMRDSPQDYPALELEFLTQSGDGPSGVSFAPNQLQATDPKLVNFLKRTRNAVQQDLAKFDFIAVIGCGLSLYKVLPTINSFNVTCFPSYRQQNNRQENPLISRACFNALVQDILRKSLAYQYVNNLRAICNRPLIVIPQPLPCETLALATDKGASFRRVVHSGNGEFARRAFQQGAKVIFSEIAEVTVLAQPETSISQHVYTKTEFTAGATRLQDVSKPQPPEDTLHANAKLGALLLRDLQMLMTSPS